MNPQHVPGSSRATNLLWSRIFNVHFLVAPFLIFSYFFNLAILDIRNIGWLLQGDKGGDLSMSLVGWLAFQHDEWRLPLTWTYLINAPNGTSVAATDSNTLASLLLKPFSGILPDTSQFIGLWFLLSVFLTYLFSYGILKQLTARDGSSREWLERTGIVAGASLMTMAPYLYFRFFHYTLTSQWLILAAIYGFLLLRGWRQILAFSALIGASVLVHPYFTPMVLLLACIAAFRDFSRPEVRLPVNALLRDVGVPVAAYAATLATAYLFVGLWKLDGHSDSTIGYYSMDPFAWFNSMGSSIFLAGWKMAPGQYEGFQYLGLGVLAAFAISLGAILTRHAHAPREVREALPWLGIYAAILFFLAVSPIITVFGKELIDTKLHKISGLGSFLTIFRSSGRLFWPASYLVGIISISILLCIRRRWAYCVVFACLGVQIIDLSQYAKEHRTEHTKTRSPTVALKSLEAWDELLSSTTELVFMSDDFRTSKDRDLFYELLARAVPRHITSNLMVVARTNAGDPSLTAQIDAMLTTPPESWVTPGRLFVMSEDFAIKRACATDFPIGRETLFHIDGVVVSTSAISAPPHPIDRWECATPPEIPLKDAP